MMRTLAPNRNLGKADLQARLEKGLLGEIVITKYNNVTYKYVNPTGNFTDKRVIPNLFNLFPLLCQKLWIFEFFIFL